MAKADLIDLSGFMKEARRRSGLTQMELADRIRVSKQTVYSWEAGRSFPSGVTLRRLSDALGVPFSKFQKLKPGASESPKQEKLHDHIRRSTQPVVSKWSPNFIPLLDKKTGAFPLDAVRNPLQWKGKRCFLPESLYPGHLFGFELEDRAMEPLYGAGDVVLADLREKVREGSHVVAKLKDRAPVCRIYEDNRSSVCLRAIHRKTPALEAPKTSIEWMYGILSKAVL